MHKSPTLLCNSNVLPIHGYGCWRFTNCDPSNNFFLSDWGLADWEMTHNAPVHFPCSSARDSMYWKERYPWQTLLHSAVSRWLMQRAHFWINHRLMIVPAPWLFVQSASPRLTHFSGSTIDPYAPPPTHRLTQSSDHKPTATPSDEEAPSCSSC